MNWARKERAQNFRLLSCAIAWKMVPLAEREYSRGKQFLKDWDQSILDSIKCLWEIQIEEVSNMNAEFRGKVLAADIIMKSSAYKHCMEKSV